MVEDVEPSVSYPVRELLSDIKAKLEQIDGKLDDKANAADLRRLESRMGEFERRGSDSAQSALRDVHDLEARVQVLETASASAAAVRSNTTDLQTQRRQIKALLVTTVVAALGVLVSLTLGLLQVIN